MLDPERHLLDSCLEVLESKYSVNYKKKAVGDGLFLKEYLATAGECDERLFLEEDVFKRVVCVCSANDATPANSMGSPASGHEPDGMASDGGGSESSPVPTHRSSSDPLFTNLEEWLTPFEERIAEPVDVQKVSRSFYTFLDFVEFESDA